MNLKNKTVIKEQFITSDDEVFENREEAMEHEYCLIRERLYANSINVYEYNVYLILEEKELNAIKEDPYGERQFNLPDKLEYPFCLCETNYDDFYYCYWTLNDVIKHEEELIEKLKSINIREL